MKIRAPGLLLVIFAFVLVGALGCDQNDPTLREGVVGQGVFDHVAYAEDSTIVYFDDGRSCVMYWNHYSIPYSKGTRIRIIKDNGYYKIEQIR